MNYWMRLCPGVSNGVDGAKVSLLVKRYVVWGTRLIGGHSNQVFKLIEDPDAGTAKLYELTTDPAETADRSSEEPEQRSYLERMISKKRGSGKAEEAVIDEAEKEQLEALGYIE